MIEFPRMNWGGMVYKIRSVRMKWSTDVKTRDCMIVETDM